MKRYKLLFSLLIIATACNCYIFFHRGDFVYIKQSSYFDLYSKHRNPSINHLETVNDSTLLLKLNGVSNIPLTWVVKRNNNETLVSNQIEPTVALKQGVSNYTVFSYGLPDTLYIKAEYYPKDYYKKIGNNQAGGIVIYKTDLPCKVDSDSIEKWGDYEFALSSNEKKDLEAILKDSMQIKQNDSTFEKIRKLGKFLCDRIVKSRGIPTDRIIAMPVFQQYKLSAAGERIWCGIYAQIFNLFATAANIKSRYIEISQSFGAIKGGVHVFNEYYIPEQKKWAAIDIMFNNIAYMDTGGNLLNGVEVKNTNPSSNAVSVLQSSFKDSVVVRSFSGLEPDFFDYYAPAKNLYYYHNINMNRISLKEKIGRYVNKFSWFEVYSDSSIADNRSFYIKQIFIIFEISLLLLLLLSVILNFFHKKQ